MEHTHRHHRAVGVRRVVESTLPSQPTPSGTFKVINELFRGVSALSLKLKSLRLRGGRRRNGNGCLVDCVASVFEDLVQ